MRFIQVFTALCFASIMLAGQNTVNAQKNGESRNPGGPAIAGSPNPNAPDGPGRRNLNSFLGGLNANIPHKFEKRQGGDSIGEIISSEKNKENPRFGWK